MKKEVEYTLITTKNCEVCRSVKDFLDRNEVGYKELSYDTIGERDLVEGLMTQSSGETLPQLFDSEGNYLASSFNIIPYISKQNSLKRKTIKTV